MSIYGVPTNGSGVPNKQYVCTSLESACFRMPKWQTVRSYYSGTLAVPLAPSELCAILLLSERSARGSRDGQRIRSMGGTSGGSAGGSWRHQRATAGQDAEGWRGYGQDADRRLGHRHLQDHDLGSRRRRDGAAPGVRRPHMNNQVPKYVTRGRAALLLGIEEEELRRISSESGLGHPESAGEEKETFFTYDELRQICLLSTQTVH